MSTNPTTNMGDNLQKGVAGNLNEFSDANAVGVSGKTSAEFADSNGIVAKFAFFVLVVICFLLGLNLGIRLLTYFLGSPSKVYIVKGMIDGTTKKNIQQNPKDSDSKLLKRSNNEDTGIEFTWAVWLRLDGFPTESDKYSTKYQPVFVKGDGLYNSDNVSSISNGPGVYFAGSSNKPNALHILMDTFSKYAVNEKSPSTIIIDISNIPIKKWFHLTIRCENKYLDVYINGLVAYRTDLVNVPLQNYDNVLVCDSGGFIGKLSNLIYYSYGLSIVDITSLVNAGPDLTDNDYENKGKDGDVGSTYLSSSWYSQ